MSPTALGRGRAVLSLLTVLALSLASARAAELEGPERSAAAPLAAGPAVSAPRVVPSDLGALSPAQLELPFAAPAAAQPARAPAAAGPVAGPPAVEAAPAAPASRSGSPAAVAPAGPHAPGRAAPDALPASSIAGPARPAGPDGAPQPGSGREPAPSALEQARSLGRAAAAAAGKPGFDAAFDGAAPLSEAAHAAEAAGDRDYDAAAEFRRANPGSAAVEVLSMLGRFDLIANEAVLTDVFTQIHPGTHDLDSIVAPQAPESIRRSVLEVLRFADRAGADPAAARFVRYLGRLSTRRQIDLLHGLSHELEPLAPNPLGRGEYWDLAAGPNGLRHMLARRDPHTLYRFFDSSDYVVAMLQEGKRLMAERGLPAANIEIVKGDVNRLARPPTPIAVLRNKNVHTYVPGFEKKLDQMTDWIAEGGVLLLENDPGPQRFAVVERLRPMIERLISEGWTLRFSGFKSEGLETLALTRPRRGQPKTRDAESARVWQDYLEDVGDEMGGSSMAALLHGLGLR